ncbi:MAG: hypothetical protein KC713_03580 [Candidatus Omnitrophica bacterium]|nr:hypothetical protein [Candidatus Omnitrophota bacterium]
MKIRILDFVKNFTVITVLFLCFPVSLSYAAISATCSATNNGAGSTTSLTHGCTINADDVIIVLVHVNNDGLNIVDNSGTFTEVINEDNGAESSTYAIYSKVSAGSEPATYTWDNDESRDWTVILRVFSGVDTANIWDVTPSAATRDFDDPGTTATAPTMSISTSGAMGILWVISDSSETWSNPTNGYGSAVEEESQSTQASYIRLWATTGGTGASSADLGGSNDWLAHQFALKPAAASGPLKGSVMVVSWILPFFNSIKKEVYFNL